MKSTNRPGLQRLSVILLSTLLIGAAPEEGKQPPPPAIPTPEPGTVEMKTETPDVEEEVEFTYGIDGIVTKQVRKVQKKTPEEAKAAKEAKAESVEIILPAAPGEETTPETAELQVKPGS
jgi:hypothetical protein